jgi:hypothetical protein
MAAADDGGDQEDEMPKRVMMLLAAALLTVPIVLMAAPAGAVTTITVTNAGESGAGSLRQAFVDASQGGAHQNSDVTISVPASVGNITLTSGELQYDGGNGGGHSLVVSGSGQTISTSTSGGMDVNSTGTLTVSNLKIAISADGGDGIFSSAHVVGDHLTVTGGDEGIIAEGGSMTLTDSQVTDSVRTGVESEGNITLIGSTTRTTIVSVSTRTTRATRSSPTRRSRTTRPRPRSRASTRRTRS